MRNLKRINQSGIPSPEPFILKSNLMIMEFIGKEGVPAPRLKDVETENGEFLYQ